MSTVGFNQWRSHSRKACRSVSFKRIHSSLVLCKRYEISLLKDEVEHNIQIYHTLRFFFLIPNVVKNHCAHSLNIKLCGRIWQHFLLFSMISIFSVTFTGNIFPCANVKATFYRLKFKAAYTYHSAMWISTIFPIWHYILHSLFHVYKNIYVLQRVSMYFKTFFLIGGLKIKSHPAVSQPHLNINQSVIQTYGELYAACSLELVVLHLP